MSLKIDPMNGAVPPMPQAIIHGLLQRRLGEVLLFPIVLSVLLIAISFQNFLLFHTLAELFAIAVSVIMLTIAWQTYPYSRNAFLMFLACGYFWVGAVDLVHTLSYKGMSILPISDANPATQLWIIARYLQALVLILAPFVLSHSIKSVPIFLAFGLIVMACLGLIYTDAFPDAFIDGVGLTPFKIGSEYVIIAMLAVALGLMAKHRVAIGNEVFAWMAISIILTMGAELAFTFYVSVYGFSNLIGHIFKLFSFWLIFVAIIRVSLREPYVSLEKSVAERTHHLTDEIAERKRTAAALVHSQDSLANAQRIAMLGNWDWDIPSNDLWWSDEIYRIFGLEPQEFKASYETFLEMVHPDDRRPLQDAVAQAIKDKKPYSIDHRIVLRDGTEKIVHEHAEVSFDAAGKPVRMSGTVQDISERKLGENALQEAKAEAEAANRSKSEFLALMSHDLRTPLNSILGFSGILKEKTFGPLGDPHYNDYADYIHDSGQLLLNLIDDILDLAKVEAGKRELNEEALRLSATVHSAITLVQQQAT